MKLMDVVRMAVSVYPELSELKALEFATDVDRQIASLLPTSSRSMDPVTVAYSAGQREAVVPSRMSQVDGVYVDGKPLTYTTVEALGRNHRTWLEDPAGTPQFYYVASRSGSTVVGLHPKPSGAVSAKVYGTSEPSDLDFSSETSPLVDPMAYVYGILLRACPTLHPEHLQMWQQLFVASLETSRGVVSTANEPMKANPQKNVRNG